MVLPGKTSSGGAAAPEGVAQRTSRQQLQTELPAERQVSGWTRAWTWLLVSCWRAAQSGVRERCGQERARLAEFPPNKRNSPSLQSLSWTQRRHRTANHSCLVRESLAPSYMSLHIIRFTISWCINRRQHICALSLVQLLWVEIIHSNDLIFIFKVDELVKSTIVKQLTSWS